ncbi:sensor domain-containing diguanylate cyclase [candidate division WOR-3 bacterium]|jgi:diguanylate cyclase (GGDEF)-like protein|nr:sensor domain-containing diguanylate cyclase [candidate division WOR-3 bacterium]
MKKKDMLLNKERIEEIFGMFSSQRSKSGIYKAFTSSLGNKTDLFSYRFKEEHNIFSLEYSNKRKIKNVLNTLFIDSSQLPGSINKKKGIVYREYKLNRLKIKQIFKSDYIGKKNNILLLIMQDESFKKLIVLVNKNRPISMDFYLAETLYMFLKIENMNDIISLNKSNNKMYGDHIKNLEKKLHILNYLTNNLMATLSLEDLLDTICRIVSEKVGFKIVLINMLSDDYVNLERVASSGIKEGVFNQLKTTRVPVENIKYLLKNKYKISNYIYFIRNIYETKVAKYSKVFGDSFNNNKEISWRNEYTILIPFYDRNKNLIGTMSLDKPSNGKIPDSRTLELLGIIAKFATLAIRNAVLYKNTIETMDELSNVYGITSFISKVMPLDDLLKNLVTLLKKNFKYINVSILKIQEKVLKVYYASNYPDEEISMINKMLLSTDRCIANRSRDNKKSYLIKDSRKDSDFIHIGNTNQSEIAIPIIIKNRVWGVLSVEKKGVNSLNEKDLKLLEIIVNHLSTAMENIELYQKLNVMANTDSMTSLYNYRFLKNHLKKRISETTNPNTIFSLIMIDMNNFKYINDTYGHLAGDEVLQWLSSKMIIALGGKCKISRYGGDEFLIVFDGKKKDAAELMNRFRKNIREKEFIYNDKIIKVDFSIGVMEYPTNAHSLSDLIDRVDKALYNEKNIKND